MYIGFKRFSSNIKHHYSYGIVPFYKDYNKELKYLLLLQKNGNFWFFPKGKPESGETPLQTALRETLEESGLDRNDFKKIYDTWKLQIDYSYNTNQDGLIHKTVILYPGEITNETELEINYSKEEILDFKWVGLKDGREMLSYDSHRKLFSDLHFKLKLYLQFTG